MQGTLSLSKEQIEQYHEDGFLLVKGLFHADELKEIEEGLADVACRRAEYPQGKFILEQILEDEMNRLPPMASVRKINHLQDEPWAKKFWGPQSLPKRMCAELVSKDDLLMMGLFTFAKPAKHGSSTPWHQDQALWQFFAPGSLSCWTAIDECTEENGYLQFYRGGHKEGLLRHIMNEGDLHVYIPKEEIDPKRIAAVPMEPGDSVFFGGMIPHFSEPNRSDKRRIGMPAVYGSEADFERALHTAQWLQIRKEYNLPHIINQEFINSRRKMFGH